MIVLGNSLGLLLKVAFLGELCEEELDEVSLGGLLEGLRGGSLLPGSWLGDRFGLGNDDSSLVNGGIMILSWPGGDHLRHWRDWCSELEVGRVDVLGLVGRAEKRLGSKGRVRQLIG